MDAILLARLQFAVTIMFHFLFPPITIGLSVLLVIIESFRWRTGDAGWRRAGLVAVAVSGVLWIAATVLSWIVAPHLWVIFRSHALPWILPVLFVAALVATFLALRARRAFAAWLASSTALVAVLGTAGCGTFPRLVAASNDISRSLTIYNASSSDGTLRVMLIIALLGMPLVLVYTFFVNLQLRGKADAREGGY